jgi:hypothetical protein
MDAPPGPVDLVGRAADGNRHKSAQWTVQKFIFEPEQRVWLPFRFVSDVSFRVARNVGTSMKNAPGNVPGA